MVRKMNENELLVKSLKMELWRKKRACDRLIHQIKNLVQQNTILKIKEK